MAYPVIDGPYGLKPVNLIGGQVFAGATRQIPIASGDSVAIFNGDVVKLTTDGVVARDGATTALNAGAVGVFLGCQYTDPSTGQVTNRQSYPGSITADDIVAYVADDPDQLYKVAVCSATTTIASLTRAEAVGSNIALIDNAGDANTGNSKVAVDEGTQANTATLPMRIIDVVEETKTTAGEFTEVIVKFNTHTYNTALGLA